MKECIKCKKKKEYSSFYKSVKHKDGYFNICKECNKEKYIIYREKNIKYQKEYIKNNKEKISIYNNLYQKEYIKNNKDKKKKYYVNNKEKISTYNKIWREKNKNKINEYNRQKYKNNTQYKLKNILRSRFHDLLNKNKKEISIIDLIGCSIKELKLHLESLFLPEMSWENHGEIWEIDHIKSCSSFNLTDVELQKECFHYSNLQPLFKTTEIAEQYGYKNIVGNRNKSKNL
jgi:hypothetical protein